MKLCEIMVKHVKSAFPPVPGGPCQNLDMIIHANSMPFWDPGPRGTPKSLKMSEMVGFRGIPPIWVVFTKKAPGTVFLVEIHPETNFWVPGTPKKA